MIEVSVENTFKDSMVIAIPIWMMRDTCTKPYLFNTNEVLHDVLIARFLNMTLKIVVEWFLQSL